jgi:hypothetical protein
MTRILIRVIAGTDKPARLFSRWGSETDLLLCLTLEDGYGCSPVVELACRQEGVDIRMAVEADGCEILPDRQRLLPGRRQGRQVGENEWFRRMFTKEER